VFEAVAVPLASPWTRGVTWRGLHTVAFDGLNSVKVPDSDRNRCWLGKLRNRLGLAGYADRSAGRDRDPRAARAVIGGTGERAEVPLARSWSRCCAGACCCWPTVPMTRPAYLSRVDGLRVRIIEADLDVHGADGTRIGDSYRLITGTVTSPLVP
jgi:hypothetical protein